MNELRLAVDAMATRFELVLWGADKTRLRAAGEEALGEIVRLDRQLSAYSPASDVSWINGHAAEGPVPVEPRLFWLLRRCQELSAETGGAFDITVGPLMRAWRLAGGAGAVPEAATLEAARRAVGSGYLVLDSTTSTVAFERRGMSIDFGAAGKGYAIDCAIDILRDAGVDCALLQGGTSSVHLVGCPPDPAMARIAWRPPDALPRTFLLNNSALAVSAVHGKSFVHNRRRYGHVIDPLSGEPVRLATAAVAIGPRSFECDALSTALLVHGSGWLPQLRERFAGYDGDVVAEMRNSTQSALPRAPGQVVKPLQPCRS